MEKAVGSARQREGKLRRVFLISPFRGSPTPEGWISSRDGNLAYLRRCIVDCFARGEAPFAPHGLYPGALDDNDPKERAMGMEAGRAWLATSEAAVCYVDRGVSSGMRGDLNAAVQTYVPPVFTDKPQPLSIDFRRLGEAPPTDLWLHENDVPHRGCAICRMNATTRNAVALARKWLETVPVAVSGDSGHQTAFRVIEKVVRGFDLTDGEAFEVLEVWNARCEPPWSDEELRRKIRDAEEHGDTRPCSLLSIAT